MPEETGPSFRADVKAVCRITVAKIERQRAMTEGGKKPPPVNSSAYLWNVTESE